ncbi:MAG: alpha/beta hydrolase [Anaerolineales bacterium]
MFVLGLSMGGVLTLYHASFLPIAGLVSMSTIYQIDDARLKILPILSKFVKYIDKGKSDWQDEQAVEDHFSYDYYPTKALLQLAKLLQAMRNTLPDVTVPALLMHSRLDIGVPLANLEKIYRAIGTPENLKEKIVLEHSGHVVTRDKDKEIVFSAISNFINENIPPSS